ncbi:hypothetical protein TCAL_06788 [Tigriopus californicus]|uniref:GRIP domain-containing protein n=1 Tax=Tigriopus californicus TaxID=6832 RepID=A0A553PKF7_TIGCA|nr:hypothetical protein TCAL_06788 [Tigriopus californicus]
MASWFSSPNLGNLQGSLEGLKNSVSSVGNSLKEVFEEEEDPTDPTAHLALTKEKLESAHTMIQSQKDEIQKMKERIDEIQEQKQAVELQKEVQCTQFRELLLEKERELESCLTNTPAQLDHENAPPMSSEPIVHDRIRELEDQIVEERKSHENAIFALQEAFSSQTSGSGAGVDRSQWEVKWDEATNTSERKKVFVELLQSGCHDSGVEALKVENERLRADSDKSKNEMKTKMAQWETQRLEWTAKCQAQEDRLRAGTEDQDMIRSLTESNANLKTANAKLEEKLRETEQAIHEDHEKRVEHLAATLEDEREKVSALETENSLKDDVIAALKEEKRLKNGESEAIKDTIESLQTGMEKYQAVVGSLEASLDEQVKLNEQLRRNLQESTDLNNELETEMEKIAEASKSHEIALSEMRDQLKAFKGTEEELHKFKALYAAKESELHSSLDDQNQNVEKITSETSVYKQQYEALLQEYNQYLEDLESLQAKAEGLEKLKALHEEKMNELKEAHNQDQARIETLDEKFKENEKKRELLEELLDRTKSKNEEVEHELCKERGRKRELEEELEDKDILIEDLKNGLQLSKESSVCEEKEQDESETDLRAQIQSLKAQIQKVEGESHALNPEALTDLQEINENQAEEIQRLEEIIKEFNDDVAETAKKIEEQSDHLMSAEAELERYKEEVSDSNRKFEEYKDQFQTLQLEFETYMSKTEEDREFFAQDQQILDDLQQNFDELKVENESCKTTISQLEAEKQKLMANQQESLGQKQHILEDLQRKFDELQIENESCKTTISQLEAEKQRLMANQQESLGQKQHILEDLQRRFDELKVENESCKITISRVEAEKKELMANQDLEGELHSKSEEIANLKACLATLKSTNADVAQDQSKKIQLLKDELEQKIALERDLQDQVRNFSEQVKAIEQLTETVKELENNSQTLQTEVDSKSKIIEQLTHDMEEKHKLISEHQDDLQQMNIDLEMSRVHLKAEKDRIQDLESQLEMLSSKSHQEAKFVEAIERSEQNIQRLESDNKALLERLSRPQKHQSEKEDMTKETVNKLSQLIRDKDMEIQALQERNRGLVDLIQKHEKESSSTQTHEDNKLTEEFNDLQRANQDLLTALNQKHQESLGYYAEIERLNQALEVIKASQSNSDSSPNVGGKSVRDNTNEIVILKSKIRELERKLNNAQVFDSQRSNKLPHRRRYHSESIHDVEGIISRSSTHHVGCEPDDDVEKQITDDGEASELSVKVQERDAIIRDKSNEVLEIQKTVNEREEALAQKEEEIRALKRKTESLDLHQTDALRRLDELKFELDNVQIESKKLSEENQGLSSANNRFKVLLEEKSHDLEMAQRNLQQLREMVDEKSQNSESTQQERLKNLAAITELQSQIGILKRQGDETQLKLSDRDRELAETRREVANVIEKKKRLEQELERLRQHLLTVVEEAFRVSNAQQSSSNQESSLQVESLQRQVSQLSEQRDQLLHKLGKVTQEFQSQSTALDNLTMVLEGFQEEKENNLKLAEKDYHERLQREVSKQGILQEEIKALNEKLAHANEGLAAANRLGEQLEKKSQVIANLKQEIKLREELLKKAQSELTSISTHNAGKVDKSLIKNLVVGYACADDSKKPEVLKVVATVLDFNGEERQKTGLDGSSNGSWLRGLFAPSSHADGNNLKNKTTSNDVQAATGLDQGLAQAFVQFLENESTPKVPPKLPVSEMAETKTRQMEAEMSSRSSRNSTPSEGGSIPPESAYSPTGSFATPKSADRNSPNPLLAVNSAHALPTFSVNRSSSAILKHVLQEGDSQK